MPALRAQVGARGHVLGVDVTPAVSAAAARHGRTRHGHLVAADCTRLPLPGGSVQGIFSAGCSTISRTCPRPCPNGPVSPRPTASCCSSIPRAARSAPPGTAALPAPTTCSRRGTCAARWR
ncbi:hypothetical protein ACIPWI_21280 [Streptomyces sp. NPDC090046]|uniref:hypothetical protein n=1 Tax=Streptomyces sp. NPDC090046 TaxID=3365928 RepID=UPI0038010FDB